MTFKPVILFLLCLFFVLPASAEEIQEIKTPSGMHGYLIEDHANPLISLAIGFKAGWAYDPQGLEGIAHFLGAMLTEGAGELDSQAFQRELADNGISFSIDEETDNLIITMTFLTEEKDRAIRLLRMALTAPRFDKDAMERVRKQMLVALSQQKNDPNALAAQALHGLLYPNHAYGRADQFTSTSVNRIDPQALRTYTNTYLTRDRLYAAAAGDLNGLDFTHLLEEALGALPEKSDASMVPPAQLKAQAGIAVVERDLPQSVIAFAQPGIAIAHPDFFAAYLVNYVLGSGGFESRLMKEIRVKRGLSYGIDTDLDNRDASSLLSGSVQTKRGSTKETIDLIKQTWKEFRDQGPTQEELEAAKTYVLGYYPRNFATLESSAQTLLGLQLQHLGKDYPETRQDKFKAVTLEDARRVAHALIDADHLTFVVVGNPTDITADLHPPARLP